MREMTTVIIATTLPTAMTPRAEAARSTLTQECEAATAGS